MKKIRDNKMENQISKKYFLTIVLGQKVQRLLLVVALALVGVLPLLHPGSASAASGYMLDQSQTKQDIGGMIGSGEYRTGEVFTAGIYGILDRVSIVLANYAPSPATGPVNVSIQTVTDKGLPSGTQIGSGTIPLQCYLACRNSRLG